MSTPRQHEAEEYLKTHKVLDLMNHLTSMLLFYRPERPKEFLITKLEQLAASKLNAADRPCLIDDSNLDAVFRILDPTNQGHISYIQYKEALKILGINDFNECHHGLESDRITRETFKREAKDCLLRSSATYQI